MSVDALAPLRVELDRLAEAGVRLDIWWRDDDAIEATPSLDRLLATAERVRWPLSLAAIPDRFAPSLVGRLASRDDVTVLVHGWRHANHAPPDEKTTEFGAHRPTAEMVRDMSAARERILAAFGDRALSVFVPPWNRISPEAAAHLPRLGYRALSCFGGGDRGGPVVRLDTHLDPVDWRAGRTLLAPGALVAQLNRALARGATRIGWLTHHLMFDEALWSFCEGFADLVARHPALRPIGLSHGLVKTLAADRSEPAEAGVMGAAA